MAASSHWGVAYRCAGRRRLGMHRDEVPTNDLDAIGTGDAVYMARERDKRKNIVGLYRTIGAEMHFSDDQWEHQRLGQERMDYQS